MNEVMNELINGLIFSIVLFFAGQNIFNKKLKFDIHILLSTIIYVTVYMLAIYTSDLFLEIIIYYISIIVYYRLLFKENIFKIIHAAILSFILRAIADILIIIFKITLFYNYSFDKLEQNSIYMNILTSLLLLGIIFFFQKEISFKIKHIKTYKINNIKPMVGIFTIMIITIFLKISSKSWSHSIKLIILITILIFVISIIYQIINQKNKVDQISGTYVNLVKYCRENEKLIEEYRKIVHENKNQLLIIKNLLNNKNKEAINYIDSLLNVKRNIKYDSINDISNIPIIGLKGLLNYKIIEMKKNNLYVEVNISRDLKETKIDKLDNKDKEILYSIIGVYLDNAIEAAKNSNKRMVSIQIYNNNDTAKIVIANTFSNKVDLKKINNLGYTSKGKNRGTGLTLVKELIDENFVYNSKTEIFQEFFVQNLYIDVKKKQKII